MSEVKGALPAEGGAKPAPNTPKPYETDRKDRWLVIGALVWCLLAVDVFLWSWPWGLGITVLVFLWYGLLLAALGAAPYARWENRVMLAANLFLAATFALTSNPWFRLWNTLALLALAPIHAFSLSGGVRYPWHRPIMLLERFGELFGGLFGRLGAVVPALTQPETERKSRSVLPVVLGLVGSLVLVSVLLPVLSSADALFAAATAEFQAWLTALFGNMVVQLLLALALTPAVFSLVHTLRRPAPIKPAPEKPRPVTDGLTFAVVLAALAVLYGLFLAVQSAGLFGGEAYLAARGLSYAQWARSGFFQMVGVTVLNLTVLMAALTFARPQGGAWRAVRILGGALVAESLVLLLSAGWRMSLYVSAYGLSFKRGMTYWGMGMMALFFLIALGKILRPGRSFWRWAAPVALAGWLVINCVPMDYLVAKDQVDRYLDGRKDSIDINYLVGSTSLTGYDGLGQLRRLDGGLRVRTPAGDLCSLSYLLDQRAGMARENCAGWQTWSLSACLAAKAVD